MSGITSISESPICPDWAPYRLPPMGRMRILNHLGKCIIRTLAIRIRSLHTLWDFWGNLCWRRLFRLLLLKIIRTADEASKACCKRALLLETLTLQPNLDSLLVDYGYSQSWSVCLWFPSNSRCSGYGKSSLSSLTSLMFLLMFLFWLFIFSINAWFLHVFCCLYNQSL